MSLADKVINVAIDGTPLNPLQKLAFKLVFGTKLGRKIALRRMKKNWKSAFAKKGKVDKGKVAKVAKGIVSDKEAEMPEMLRKILSLGAVVEPKTPKNPRANPYEVRINGEIKSVQEILKDMADTSLKDVLKDMHKENDYKFLQNILGDNINLKVESLEELYAGKKQTKEDEKKAVNPYSDEALEKRGLEMHIFEVSIGGLGRPLIPGVPEPMAGYQERPVAIGGVKDHIYMFNGKPVYELDGRYYYTEIVPKGTKPKKGFLTKKEFLKMNNVDTNKDHSIDLEHLKNEIQKLREQNKELTGLKPWQHRLSDGTIVATGVRRDPAREGDDQGGFKFVDREARQIILSDGTIVKLATSEAEKPTKEQIINPDQNKKLEKNPWVIHLDKVAQNFQKHEDYFKQKYGLILSGRAIMPAHTKDISSTLVATKGGRQ